jgi:two-component system OmpR family response regulator
MLATLKAHQRRAWSLRESGMWRLVDRDGTYPVATGLFEGAGFCGGVNVRLLVVEDDKDLNRQIVAALEQAGYAVDRAFDGEEGLFLGDTEPYDAIVLDVGLPKKDGIAVLEEWRAAGRTMPVLILTARDRWSDKVQGFDAGADDYVAKPFHMEEILARLRALLRRAAGHATSELSCGPVRLDTKAGRVVVDGNPVKLTSHEYRLLAYLMHHAGRVISRSELVEHLYDQDFDRDSNTIEVFVGRLRKKLGVDFIQTIRGLGYLIVPPQSGEISKGSSRT